MKPPDDTTSTAERVDVVLDANVILEIATIADLNRAALDCPLLPEQATDPRLEQRRRRTRSSLTLAWFLHCRQWTSLSLQHETLRMTVRVAPPESADGAHTWFFTWFLKDYVLPNWNNNYTNDPAFNDSSQNGNACDRTLVRLAHATNAPLVTNELKPKGAIAKESQLLGVPVLTPAGYLQSQGVNEESLANALLAAVEAQLLMFLLDQRTLSEPATDNVAAFYSVLRFILTDTPRAHAQASPNSQATQSPPS